MVRGGGSRGQGAAKRAWGVRGVAGVGERPVSERHMPDFVSEAGERGKVAEAEGQRQEQEEAVKSFDLGRVRERLAAVRAAEAHRQQQERGSGFDLNKTRERLAAVRAAEAHKKQREAQGEQRSSGTEPNLQKTLNPNPNPNPNPKPKHVTVDESVAVVDSGSISVDESVAVGDSGSISVDESERW